MFLLIPVLSRNLEHGAGEITLLGSSEMVPRHQVLFPERWLEVLRGSKCALGVGTHVGFQQILNCTVGEFRSRLQIIFMGQDQCKWNFWWGVIDCGAVSHVECTTHVQSRNPPDRYIAGVIIVMDSLGMGPMRVPKVPFWLYLRETLVGLKLVLEARKRVEEMA
jgi:hypothetical protein